MKIKPVLFLLLIMGYSLLESCSSTKPSTQISGTWKDPEAMNYRNFFVAVLSKNLSVRSTMEDDIARRLKHEKVKAAQSLDIIPHAEKVESEEDKKAAVEKIQSLGYDAIITVVLIKKTEEEQYVKGTTSYTPTNIGVGSGYYNPIGGAATAQGSYGAFGAYYIDASTIYTTPGYYETDKIYFVESRVFDAKTKKLIWSAKSETFYPGDLGTASGDFSAVMVDAMKKANLIYHEEKAGK